MTNKDKQHKLLKIKQKHTKVVNKKIQLDEMKELYESLKGSGNDIGIVKSKNNSNITLDKVVEYNEIQEEYKCILKDYVLYKNNIIKAIEQIEDVKCVELLQFRYIQFLSWGDISCKMRYDYNYVFKVHKRALKMLSLKDV